MHNNKLFIVFTAIFILFSLSTACFVSCSHHAKINVLKAAIKRNAEDAYNNGNIDALEGHISKDFIKHNPPGADVVGLDAFKESVKNTRIRLPDCRLTIGEIVIDGNFGSMMWTFEGTVSDQAPGTNGIAGKSLHETGCSFIRLESGKLAEEWMYVDDRGVLQQMGYKLMPPLTETTFAMVTQAQVKPGKVEDLVKIEHEMSVPLFKSYEDFRGFYFMGDEKTGKVCGITMWNNQESVAEAMQSDNVKAYFEEFTAKTKDLFVVKPTRENYTVVIQE
ncbi:MAG: ester cyclase [Candidatus Latescibacteria bacterium]|nr:ester cyclase [Candidatus Latescibacterota bacterium]